MRAGALRESGDGPLERSRVRPCAQPLESEECLTHCRFVDDPLGPLVQLPADRQGGCGPQHGQGVAPDRHPGHGTVSDGPTAAQSPADVFGSFGTHLACSDCASTRYCTLPPKPDTVIVLEVPVIGGPGLLR